MSSAPEAEADPISSNKDNDDAKTPPEIPTQPAKEDGIFECNICFDTPSDPVVSFCGHLFCWPCLHGWLEMRPGEQTCPVCKAAIDRQKLIPLYGRNSKHEDPREKTVPPRPQAQRTEPTAHQHPGEFIPFPGFGFGNGGFHMTVGFGSLPFTFIANALNLNGGGNGNAQARVDEGAVSRVFFWLAVILILYMIFF